jgi:SAM-dependent methyltransferase
MPESQVNWIVSKVETRAFERNLLSERYTGGRWVTFNRCQLLANFFEKSNVKTFILDMGCGGGEYSNLILKHTHDIRQLVGLDVSKELVRKARMDDHSGNGEFLVADGQNVPFKNECFDWIVCKDLLHHVEHPFKVLKEISRVSRGRVVIIEANKYNLIMLLNEKHGKHQHLTAQQLEFLARQLEVDAFFLKQVHAYPFTLRVQSFHPIACIWNASASIFLIACNRVPYLAQLALKSFSFFLVPSYNVIIASMKQEHTLLPIESGGKKASFHNSIGVRLMSVIKHRRSPCASYSHRYPSFDRHRENQPQKNWRS